MRRHLQCRKVLADGRVCGGPLMEMRPSPDGGTRLACRRCGARYSLLAEDEARGSAVGTDTADAPESDAPKKQKQEAEAKA